MHHWRFNNLAVRKEAFIMIIMQIIKKRVVRKCTKDTSYV